MGSEQSQRIQRVLGVRLLVRFANRIDCSLVPIDVRFSLVVGDLHILRGFPGVTPLLGYSLSSVKATEMGQQ